jgi:hypothetical protein
MKFIVPTDWSVLVLEDTESRIAWFRERLPQATFYTSAVQAISALKDKTFQAAFLDHDLGFDDHHTRPNGTGGEVARYMAETRFEGVVVLHSVNAPARDYMVGLLPHAHVAPFGTFEIECRTNSSFEIELTSLEEQLAAARQPDHSEVTSCSMWEQRPFTNKTHGRIQKFLIIKLSALLPREYEAIPGLTVLCGVNRLVSDVVITRRSAKYVHDELAEAPLLTIDTLAPGQTLAQLVDRCDRLLKAGAPQCWVIVPERQQAWVFTGAIREMCQADVALILPLPDGQAIEIRLADMWAELQN